MSIVFGKKSLQVIQVFTVVMKKCLLLLVFFPFCAYSGSFIRIQRDFSYPVVDEFKVYWNVPTFQCHRHGIHFEKHTKQYGIIANDHDKFRGRQVNILYDPGLFPSMMKDSKDRMLEKNGGIPQLGNLTEHLEDFREVMEKAVPADFEGVGIIDFETWRPIYRQNWNDQVIYKTLSQELVRQKHPQWTEKQVEKEAARQFEEAAREFMEKTLQVAKLVRPGGTWGYYGFPYCYNYRSNYMEPKCEEMVETENNRIQWMFDESTAVYPSVYYSQKLSEEQHQKFVIGRLNEAWRVVSRSSTGKFALVYPYVWFKYYDSQDFLTEGDIYNTLETTRKYKMGGAIIWGATENVNTKEKCESLLDYLETTLGPAVQRVKENEMKNKGFVLFPFLPHLESGLVTVINQTFHPTTASRPERSSTTLSPALQNYYTWVGDEEGQP